MSTKISRASVFPLLDAIDAMFANDLQLDGHVGIGRQPTEVPLHVRSDTNLGGNQVPAQFDAEVTSGVGGTHVGIKGNARASANWDGTGGHLFGGAFEGATSGRGAGKVYGIQGHAKALIGASPETESYGCELNVVAEVPVNTRGGLFIAAVPSTDRPTHQGYQATGLDAAVTFVNKPYGAPWRAGILFSHSDPTLTCFPIAPNGALFDVFTIEPTSVKDGINLDHPLLNFSGHSIKVPGFSVSGAGLVTVTAPGAKVILNDTGGNSFSVRSSVGAFSVRDETRGTDRLRIERDGALCLWPDADVVTETVTSNRTVIIEIKGQSYKLCLAT